MSLRDYERSKELAALDPPINALLMAAMSKADTRNLGLLIEAFPTQYYELQARYHAPGGILDNDPEARP